MLLNSLVSVSPHVMITMRSLCMYAPISPTHIEELVDFSDALLWAGTRVANNVAEDNNPPMNVNCVLTSWMEEVSLYSFFFQRFAATQRMHI